MKKNILFYSALTIVLFGCDQNKDAVTKIEPVSDTTATVSSPEPQNNPVVVQIGAFKRLKNAESRAEQLSGTEIITENGLKKVFVTAQNESEVYQIKQQFSNIDQPFRRLDK